MGPDEKSAKFEELLSRDKDMQAFIDQYPTLQKDGLARNSVLESRIQALLQHISKVRFLLVVLHARGQYAPAPSGDESDVSGELGAKELEAARSLNTVEALQSGFSAFAIKAHSRKSDNVYCRICRRSKDLNRSWRQK